MKKIQIFRTAKVKKNNATKPNSRASVKYGHMAKQGFWNGTLEGTFQKPFYPTIARGISLWCQKMPNE
jgi:hypothetical protein